MNPIDFVYILLLFLLVAILSFKSRQYGNFEDTESTFDRSRRASSLTDRQNTVELGRQHSRYGDIFYIEPNSQEAARIQEQLEKDEKDLPSYEEVMRMCNLTTPTAAAAALTQPPMMETSAIGIAALPAPPYSEIDPHRSVAAPPPSIATVTTVNMSEPSPSTSRAAQITT
ncbi:uncharacterized protein LOC6579160 isoform X13 [Drosophila mojavensis]|uniref:Uncharacterized protein, isoform M n=1 Tax=Drosophila mojavensis TaxID=7230 RepID=A0A0Q9X7S4_DROMO|nr:uncharacterized protein LOC6579160 isoform X13 [Drosophila mojavensis]KRG04400.1 uncharacterized protein Dmoj_GI20257, isoform M [Drosophila mojavensis]